MNAASPPQQPQSPADPAAPAAHPTSPAKPGLPLPPKPSTWRATARVEPGSKGRILLVDDEDPVRETLADVLETVGYLPSQARDAIEAMRILRQDPAVVALVTDLTMPGADGITLIKHARLIRPGLPAILLTGYAEEITSVGSVAGADFYVLRKPVPTERLIQHLECLVTKPPGV